YLLPLPPCWNLYWGLVVDVNIALGDWLKEGLEAIGITTPANALKLYDTGDKRITGSCKLTVCKEGTEEGWEKDSKTGNMLEMVEDCAAKVPAETCQEIDETTAECVPAGQGDLEGRVVIYGTDPHEPIQGATIQIFKGATLLDTKTSDADGLYSKLNLDCGTYKLHISAAGYLPEDVTVEIKPDQTVYVTELRALPDDCDGKGSASGQVVDAVTGEGVEVALNFREGIDSESGPIVANTTSNSSGNYQIDDLDSGHYTAEASADGYAVAYFNIVICGYDDGDPNNDRIPDQNGVISPLEPGNWRVVLRWGEKPSDLDLHAKLPDGSHIFYRGICRGSREESPFANLDIDHRSGFGPETITITQFQSGTYEFFVHNYSGQNLDTDSTSIKDSAGRVLVYDDNNEEVASFNVPSSGGGYFWNVFTINGSTKQISATQNIGGGDNPADWPGQCNP
ncbi:MAG: carboxypeptidase regulatory-like domain-containing protein, partial [Deltaproteobacteria bacterium]|nr:carboxypeptidase regulatory-like domain-containing protein [Deltaproteobacteria bacterium]